MLSGLVSLSLSTAEVWVTNESLAAQQIKYPLVYVPMWSHRNGVKTVAPVFGRFMVIAMHGDKYT